MRKPRFFNQIVLVWRESKRFINDSKTLENSGFLDHLIINES